MYRTAKFTIAGLSTLALASSMMFGAIAPARADGNGAFAGALIGAAIGAASSHDSTRGAVIGAVAGGILGNALSSRDRDCGPNYHYRHDDGAWYGGGDNRGWRGDRDEHSFHGHDDHNWR